LLSKKEKENEMGTTGPSDGGEGSVMKKGGK
jgi:hypothetical protein